jgi:hypothetical protein
MNFLNLILMLSFISMYMLIKVVSLYSYFDSELFLFNFITPELIWEDFTIVYYVFIFAILAYL